VGIIWVVGGRRRFMVLAEAMVAGVASLAILWGTNQVIPSLFSSALSTSQLVPVSAPLTTLVRDVLAGTDHFLLISGVVLAAVALVLASVHGVTRMFGGKAERQG
jgi:hypothetical protein